jgi:peptidyl-prolyl cis-trans isomerase C
MSTMNASVEIMSEKPGFAYHLLRGSLEKFKKNIPELSDSQYQQARSIADKTFALESIVLSTPEARDVIVPEAKLHAAVEEVAGRYADRESFIRDLKINGLEENSLRSALHRELLFDAVLERVSAKTLNVSEIDIQIFYQLHKERFTKPEKRKVRHILITINDEFAENDRASAFSRAAAIAEKLKKSPSRFEPLAKKYSECPSAMEGGRLGEVARGTLFPELDSVLFTMQEGAISDAIETEMGFHVLYCEKINRSITVPLSRARSRIKNLLQERQRKVCQKAWLDNVQEEKDG